MRLRNKRISFQILISGNRPTRPCLRICATSVILFSLVDFDEEDKRKDDFINTRNDPLHFDSQVKTDIRDSIADPNMSVNHPTGENVDSSIDAMHGFFEYENRASGRPNSYVLGDRQELAISYVKNLLNM
jgi:hypothetical protein